MRKTKKKRTGKKTRGTGKKTRTTTITAAIEITAAQVRWFRQRRSGLAYPFSTPEDAASALVGVQAQVLPAAGLSLWNRTCGLTYRQFDNLLHGQRTLVKVWGQRGTLHIYPSREWPLIHAARSGQPTWWERQTEKNAGGQEAHQALAAQVAAMLRQRGTLVRSDLMAAGLALSESDLSAWGGVFATLVRQGIACHAGQAGNEGRFAHREVWLPDLMWNPPPADVANAEIARRYIRTYGPASLQDFAYWRGAQAASVRRWLAQIRAQLAEVSIDGKTIFVLQDDLDDLGAPPPDHDAWPVRLLYRFDPLLLGIKDKAWIADKADYARIWRPAGHVEGILLAQGRAAGTWRYDRAGNGLVLCLNPFATLAGATRAAAEECAAGVAQFFGLPLTDIVIG